MTIKEFNKKYENIKIDYPDIFKITRSTKMELLEDYNIAKLIMEYKASNIDLEKLINFQKEILDFLQNLSIKNLIFKIKLKIKKIGNLWCLIN